MLSSGRSQRNSDPEELLINPIGSWRSQHISSRIMYNDSRLQGNLARLTMSTNAAEWGKSQLILGGWESDRFCAKDHRYHSPFPLCSTRQEG